MDDSGSIGDDEMAKIIEQLKLLRLDALTDQLEPQKQERLQVLQTPDVASQLKSAEHTLCAHMA